MKRFRGPVGEFERLMYMGNRIMIQTFAFEALVVEALDRHHFDEGKLEPFSCPQPGCDAYFEKAGQWSKHAVDTRDELIFGKQFDILPDNLRGVFERHKNELERKSKMLNMEAKRMHAAWNKEGNEKREEMKRGWINQLENDEAWKTAQEARESGFLEYFSMMIGRTWVGV
jgi:hypothetical protein